MPQHEPDDADQEAPDQAPRGAVILRRTCLRCGLSWYPRKPGVPVVCGKCGSPYWNRPRMGPTYSRKKKGK